MTNAPAVQDDDAIYLNREIKRTDGPNHATVRHQEVLLVDDQIALLKALVHADEAAEKKGKALLLVGIVGCVFVFVGWVFVVGVALLPLVAGIFWWRHKVLHSDMDDRKLDAALRPLLVLKNDLKRNKACLVDVDFYAYEHTTPVLDRTEGKTFFASGTQTQRWVHPWLRMELPLIDGTIAEVSALTSAKRKSRRKRKYTKRKERLREVVRVRLKLPRPLDEAAAAALQEQLGAMPRGQERVKSAKVSGHRVEVVFALPTAARQRLRSGWSSQGFESLTDGRAIIRALTRTVRATQAARTA